MERQCLHEALPVHHEVCRRIGGDRPAWKSHEGPHRNGRPSKATRAAQPEVPMGVPRESSSGPVAVRAVRGGPLLHGVHELNSRESGNVVIAGLGRDGDAGQRTRQRDRLRARQWSRGRSGRGWCGRGARAACRVRGLGRERGSARRRTRPDNRGGGRRRGLARPDEQQDRNSEESAAVSRRHVQALPDLLGRRRRTGARLTAAA
jgi:hypothetical protein